MSEHRRSAAPRSGREAAVERSVAGRRLGRWDHTRHHLLARLVPQDRAGPLAVTPSPLPGLEVPPLRFDISIDVPGGIVRLDGDLLRALGTDRREIWRAAVANLSRLPPPPALLVEIPGVVEPLAVVRGGPWTTGLPLVPGRLHLPFDRLGPAPGPPPVLVVVAPRPEVLVIGRAGHSSPSIGPDRSALAAAAESAMTVAGLVAEADGGARLPLAPLPVTPSSLGVLSRADGFWNDVPVSEQPGGR